MNEKLFAKCEGKPHKAIKSHIKGYWINTSTPDGLNAWKALKEERKAAGAKLFDAWADKTPAGGDDSPVELETKFIFDNQWNTVDGRRVFDFYQGIVPNRDIKIGHYLQITPEMIEIRENTYKCGYCGAEYYGASNQGKFCGSCLDSPYLEQGELPLLRVLPVSQKENRKELTEEEKAELIPAYVERQTTGKTSRANQERIQKRQKIIKDCRKEIKNARTERDGLLWLMDRGINTENVIYYPHRDIFTFGWRTPLAQDVKLSIEEKLTNFPFRYELKG